MNKSCSGHEQNVILHLRESMLRKIVLSCRYDGEEWVEWIVRATHRALGWGDWVGVRDWRFLHFQKKWSWAGHVVRRSAEALVYRVTTWRDSAWLKLCKQYGHVREMRPSIRRWMKWEDVLRRYCTARSLAIWTEVEQRARRGRIWKAILFHGVRGRLSRS